RQQGELPRIVLCGDPALCKRYTLAMQHYGLGVQALHPGHAALRPGRARTGAERDRTRPVAPGHLRPNRRRTICRAS
ncbi:hypothetical protein CTI14_51320, partial [Methylobacterium radiotolerans]